MPVLRAVGTRRGDIYFVDGAFAAVPELRLQQFASGLDEVLGLGERDGAIYATQQTEVTRLRDLDGDGRADRFETLSDAWGFANYHEFSWGSKSDANGDIWVALGLSNSYHYRANFRGWAFRVTPAGEAIPIARGIRSAGGVEVPLFEVADVTFGPGVSRVNRRDRKQVAYTGAVVIGEADVRQEIMADLEANFLPEWNIKYPDAERILVGIDEEQQRQNNELMFFGLFVLVVMYMMIAIAFKFYF